MNHQSVSIALVTFNGEKYLPELLKSIIKQTVKPAEIVVCDDCSTDQTLTILEKYESILPLRIFMNDQRLGVNRNFEKAIELCTGDIVSLCDQDDIWHSDKIETLLYNLNNKDLSLPTLIRSNSIKVNNDLTRNFGPVFRTNYSSGLYKQFFHPNSQGAGMLFNRKLKDLILPFPQIIDSYDFYIAMVAEIAGRSYYIPKPLMQYRLHSENTVGVSEKVQIFARVKKLLKGDYLFYVPGAFLTLDSIARCDRFYINQKKRKQIDNILSLISYDHSKLYKIILLHAKGMACLKSRVILTVKLIFQKSNKEK